MPTVFLPPRTCAPQKPTDREKGYPVRHPNTLVNTNLYLHVAFEKVKNVPIARIKKAALGPESGG